MRKTKAINNNAIEVLQQVMQQRNWHQGCFDRRNAFKLKQSAAEGTLKYNTACEVLAMLGWQKIKEETWQQLTEEERLKKAANEPSEKHIARVTSVTKALYADELKNQ